MDEATAAGWLREALEPRRGAPPPESDLQAAASRFQDAHRDRDPTARWLRRAAGLDGALRTGEGERLVGGDLVLVLAAGSIGVLGDPGLDPEDADALLAVRPRDWAAVVAGVVEAGPGAPADPDALARHARDEALEPGHLSVVAHALGLVVPAWRLLGILDGEHRLTRLGAWLLPRAACLVWGDEFD